MPWFMVDDKLHSHRKAVRAGVQAMGLWVLAGSWSMDHLTDGFIPTYMAERIDRDVEVHGAELVAAGLWTEAERNGEQGWQFHGWDEFQPTREAVEAKREAARERMARVRGNKKGSSREVRANGKRTSQSVRITPAQPSPTQPNPSSNNAAVAAEFDAFYDLYPRKADRARAAKAYAKARKSTDAATIVGGLTRQLPWFAAQLKAEGDFRPHAATWLNNERWGDAPVVQIPTAPKADRSHLPEAWR